MKVDLDPESGQKSLEGPEEVAQVPLEYLGPSLDSSAAAKQRVQDVILAALQQRLPRNRPLHAWEPKKLHARHVSMICDRATGLRAEEIAAKYDMHQNYVNIILTHPDSIIILGAITALNADKLTDVNARLQGYAHEMLTGKVEIFRTTPDKRLKDSIASDLLDRAGYGSRQKLDISAAHRFVLPTAAAMSMAQALDEDKRVADLDYSNFTGRKLGQSALESGVFVGSQGESEQLSPVNSASPDASPAQLEQHKRSA